MNKLRPSNIVLCVVLTTGIWYGLTQAQTIESRSAQNRTIEVGRDNPFANFLSNEKSAAQAIPQVTQIPGQQPELFLETIALKSLSVESFQDVIEDMLSPYGTISVDKKSNTLVVYDTKEALAKIKSMVPTKELVTEDMVHRSYRIVYANIDDVEKTLKTFISKSGSISANPSTSNILVVDYESNIKVIDNFVKEIDRLMQQVLVEVRIYDVTSTEGFDIGAEWDIGRNNPITDYSTNTSTDAIVKNNLTGATTTDTTTINTVKTTETAWQRNDAGVPADNWGDEPSYAYRKSKPFVGGSFDSATAGTIKLGLLDTVNAEITLNILRTQVGAKLLANPRILVLDNETAEFKIVSEIPYTEASQTSEGGELTSIEFKEVGVELEVTPHITREGMIRLHIVPEFGVVTEAGQTLDNGIQTVPTVDTRRVDTKALVKDGQTVVLGGLRKRTVSQDVTKIPFLADIPLLGRLFMDVEESVETNELIIFITPKIVVDPTLSEDELKGLKETKFSGPKPMYTEDEKAERKDKKTEQGKD